MFHPGCWILRWGSVFFKQKGSTKKCFDGNDCNIFKRKTKAC